VAFDALGSVVGIAASGKPPPSPAQGDSILGFRPDLTESEIDLFLAGPTGANAALLLADATTRLVPDFSAYWREPDPLKKRPTFMATIERETHVSDLAHNGSARLHVSFVYSDGFGREIQSKIQAESGPVPTRDANGAITLGADGQPEMTPQDVGVRWVGSGWTVFDNKGNPVREYEPFFTDTHRFEFDVRIGVSSIRFYDPVGRTVGTLRPDHTWEKVVFGPWHEVRSDANDTVLVSDPAADADMGDYFGRLSTAEYLPTWHALRTSPVHSLEASARWPDPSTRGAETAAAERSSVHAATPTLMYVDPLGRTFVTVVRNRFRHSDSASPIEESYATRLVLDIDGNQRQVIDAKGRVAIRYAYDLRGNRIRQSSMEAGERWMLDDVRGTPVYSWSGRGHRLRMTYDVLRRPTHLYVREGASTEILVEQKLYGEARTNPEARNLRGQVFEVQDQAGTLTYGTYDFKGNLLASERRFALQYDAPLDWNGPVPLETVAFRTRTRYDALDRPVQVIAPHSDEPGATVNTIQHVYNEARLLEQVHVWLSQNAEPSGWLDPTTASVHVVTDIDYNAAGRRILLDRGTKNGTVVRTTYAYDPATARLTRLYTRRGVNASTGQITTFADDCESSQPTASTAVPDQPQPGKYCGLQNLSYTYDPVGNITHIRDDAQPTIYFRNRRVDAVVEYTYDSAYRLIEASGREHLGQAAAAPIPHSYNDGRRVGTLHPGDGNAMGRYVERYGYDAVGNFLSMQHRGSDPANPGWSRAYFYEEESQLEAGSRSNRLTKTVIGGTTETYSNNGDGYDAHGNMCRMPHLQEARWDFRDQLQMTRRQAVDPADAEGVEHGGERTWYVYDSAGQRLRKVTKTPAGDVKEEQLYLGCVDIFRRTGTHPLVSESLHVMDDERRLTLVEMRSDGNPPDMPTQLVRSQFDNHLGSACLEMDDEANILSYEEYTPYGSTSYQAVRSQTQMPKRYRYSGKERDEQSGLYYHGARYYAPWLGRWMSSDPLVDSHRGGSTYSGMMDNPAMKVDPDGRDAILVAFPDYKVDTEIPTTRIGPVTLFNRRQPLGHGGVILIDNKTGATKYYEYGRYPTTDGTKGRVRGPGTHDYRSVPNVVIGKDGKPTQDSLKVLLDTVSVQSGQRGRIEGAYIKSDKFKEMNDYAQKKLKESNPGNPTYDKKRPEYGLTSNNCGTFAADVVDQDPNVARPTVVLNPTPTNIVDEYQEEGHERIQHPAPSVARPKATPTPTPAKPGTGQRKAAPKAAPKKEKPTGYFVPQPRLHVEKADRAAA
jgi:RHS repeat-associated protein